MRTLRKTLCLVLALVMVLGVCAVGASAVEFTDESEINYKKAVAVLSSIGVLTGIEVNGEYEFQPAGILTRAQAATIIARLLNADDSELSTKSTFTDCRGHWADGYIAYAASKGIVAGYGDGNFGPEDKLTGFAFAKMLLCAIGYNAEAEGLVGDSWAVAVATLAKKAGIINGISPFDGTGECSREQACQMAYNALYANLIMYRNSGSTITAGDVNITISSASSYKTNETLYKDVFHLSDEDNPDEMENPYDDYGREAVLEIYDADGNVIYNEYPEADYIYYNASVEEQGKADVAKAYAKANGLKESDIKIVNWPGDYDDVQPSPMPSFAPMAVLMSDPYAGYGPRPVFPDEYFEFTVSADKKTITFVTAYWYDYAAILDIKDTADKDAEYTKDIFLTEYYENIICSLMSDNLYTWTVHEDELTVGEKGDWIAYIVNYLPDSMGNVNYKDAVVLDKNQGVISAYNSDTQKVTIGGKTLGIDYECVDPDYVFDPIDFNSVMDYYISPNGKLAAVLIPDDAEEAQSDFVYVVKYTEKAYVPEGTDVLNPSAAKDASVMAEVIFTDGTHSAVSLNLTGNATAGYKFERPVSVGFTFESEVEDAENVAVGNWFAYVEKEDGSIVLSAIDDSYATVCDKDVSLEKGKSGDISGYKTTSATKYVSIDTNYVVTEAKGLVDVEMDSSNNAILVTYSRNSSIASVVYAVKQSAPDAEASYTGMVYAVAAGDTVADGVEWSFYEDGKLVTYVISGTEPEAKKVYKLVKDSKKDIYTVGSPIADVSGEGSVVTIADESFFTADADYYYDTNTVICNVAKGHTGEADTIAVGDSVVVYVVSSKLAVVYIVAEAE